MYSSRYKVVYYYNHHRQEGVYLHSPPSCLVTIDTVSNHVVSARYVQVRIGKHIVVPYA